MLKILVKTQATCKNRRGISAERWCYGLNCTPSNSYVEARIPNVTAFGDWSFKEVIKVKYGHKGEALIP